MSADLDFPVNKAYLSDSLRSLIIPDCVICGGRHSHGAKDKAIAKGERSHRVGHCAEPGTGYYVQLADDAEVPDRYLSWVLGDAAETEVSVE